MVRWLSKSWWDRDLRFILERRWEVASRRSLGVVFVCGRFCSFHNSNHGNPLDIKPEISLWRVNTIRIYRNLIGCSLHLWWAIFENTDIMMFHGNYHADTHPQNTIILPTMQVSMLCSATSSSTGKAGGARQLRSALLLLPLYQHIPHDFMSCLLFLSPIYYLDLCKNPHRQNNHTWCGAIRHHR